ncbi:MAG TPA: VOC family protein [Allosphingosinicella sp.]|nr:VOC family protein [Allosphingosinicella sp.]
MSATPQMRAHAPVLMVGDVVRAHAYYADKLGFRSPRMWGEPPTFCIAEREGLELMLSQVEPGKGVHPNADHSGRLDAYFWVNDADALYAEFAANGAEMVCEPEDRVYGMREFLVRDPDGHLLCFGHDTTGAA